jgi:glucose/arabinose dehydrogenase
MRRMAGAALAVLCLGSIVAACAPVKEPVKEPAPPQPQPPPPPALQPPDSPLPAGSPTLTTDTGFLTGLSNPWDTAFLADGTMFFSERVGPVSVRFPSGTVKPAVTPSDVLVSGAGGTMGIATDASFLFVCYTAPGSARVVRYPYTLNAALETVVVAPGLTVVTFPDGTDHHGCRIRLGPDGKLWITMGDGAIATAPQDLASLRGKVLRVNPDGSIPGDNPFAGSPVFTYGHRNPQGIAFAPGGQPYSIEHGSAIDDEVNKLVPGGNGGWDPIDAFGNYDGYDVDIPMTDFAKFPDAMTPVWHSGSFPPEGRLDSTVAPSGATFLTGSQWGSWDGALVVAFLKDSKARVMVLDGNGNVASSSPFLENGVRLRSAVQGPDGNLYIATDVGGGGGAIWKITPS